METTLTDVPAIPAVSLAPMGQRCGGQYGNPPAKAVHSEVEFSH